MVEKISWLDGANIPSTSLGHGMLHDGVTSHHQHQVQSMAHSSLLSKTSNIPGVPPIIIALSYRNPDIK
jgi:hypothetical protein